MTLRGYRIGALGLLTLVAAGCSSSSNNITDGGTSVDVACSCDSDAGLSCCASDCVDLATDSNNCGMCGRGCAGALCVAGSCL
jgi:hypothetical protein